MPAAAASVKIGAQPASSGKISPYLFGSFIELLDDLDGDVIAVRDNGPLTAADQQAVHHLALAVRRLPYVVTLQEQG